MPYFQAPLKNKDARSGKTSLLNPDKLASALSFYFEYLRSLSNRCLLHRQLKARASDKLAIEILIITGFSGLIGGLQQGFPIRQLLSLQTLP
jgi:hypothetical protein